MGGLGLTVVEAVERIRAGELSGAE
ncbi:MAG: hypothetical protein QOG62_2344, partial [Thermoleophilaceae bacterium]|nr:hypothetical protein [Thermoleophilaceae bacterium]